MGKGDRRARRAETVVNIYDRRARRTETLVLCEIVDNGKSSTCPFPLFDSVRKHVGFLRTEFWDAFQKAAGSLGRASQVSGRAAAW